MLGRGLNTILTLLVLTLAFLSASFLAGNSDLWFHLATGRLLADGKFTFGVDPFAYTTQHVYWACHSWLFDLALYGLLGRIGDAGLVVLKALIVTVLAGLLLRIRRPNGPVWLPLVCTTLALLAMSPRLLLQPACLSYFFLGLTFWLLWRPRQRAGSVSDGKTSVAYASGSLLLVFVLWVNVDEWFFLGPLLTALFWLGERLQPTRSANEGLHRTPGWLAPVGLAVCLLNPYTYHAYTLPAELSLVPWTSGLRQDARFHTVFSTPWDAEHWQAASRYHAAVIAYYALTLLGLVSFLLHRSARRDWRLLVWLPFAVLAAWQARLIPFFAVVAAPITALNWQDILTAGYGVRISKSRFLAGFSKLALMVGLLALLTLTWLGWLAGYDREERHVAWGVQEDPSLREVAETLERWRHRRQLPESERVFALSPEAAHYCAWFSPDVKYFFDHRYLLFPQVAREYETVCLALFGSPGVDSQTSDWQKVLSEHRVGVLVFPNREGQRLLPVLNRPSSGPANWTLLRVSGEALLVGWNKARPLDGFASLAFDPKRAAFGPLDGETRHQAPPAPRHGPAQLPKRRDFWERLSYAPQIPSWESAAATAYLYYFQNSEAAQQPRPPALPLLAIRAARRAVAANPHDANAWLRLGLAYRLLRDFTCERSAEGLLPPLARLRSVQIAAALEQALRLDPNLEAAHHELADLYKSSNVLDRSLEHRREELRLSRQAGSLPGETAEDFAGRLELSDKETAKFGALVQENRKQFTATARSFHGDRLAQARRALQKGLPKQAVEEFLMPTPAEVLGAEGVSLELDLLLSLGRAQEARDILRTSKHGLGISEIPSPVDRNNERLYRVPYRWAAYEWQHMLAAAAVGDYAQCRADLRTIRAGLQGSQEQPQLQARAIERRIHALLPSLVTGPSLYLPASVAVVFTTAVELKMQIEAHLQTLRGQQADLGVLEGMLALEQGDVTAARAAFTEAMKQGAELSFAGRPLAAFYLGKLKEEIGWNP